MFYRCHQGTISQGKALFSGQSSIQVSGHKQGASVDRIGCLGKLSPAYLCSITLDYRRRLFAGFANYLKPGLSDSITQRLRPHHQHFGGGFDFLGEDFYRIHRRRHYFFRSRSYLMPLKLFRHLLRVTGGIIGYELELNTCFPGCR